MSSPPSTLQLWREYRIPLVCMALAIATLSIALSSKAKPKSNTTQEPKGKDTTSGNKGKPSNKVQEIVQDMEKDPTFPKLSQEAVERVVEHATEDQKPYQHQGLKKEVYRRLPKVIRKKPKKKQVELDSSAATATSSGCCGGMNKPEGDTSTGCCGGKHKNKNQSTESTSTAAHACACSSATGPAQTSNLPTSQLDPSLQPLLASPMKVFYSTITGTAKLFAQHLSESAQSRGLPEPKVVDIVDYDTEDFLAESSLCIFILSTYNVEGPNDWFLKWLEDTRFDWRVERQALNKLKFSVFGLGDSAYGDEFCNGPRSADKWLGQLGAQRVWPFGEGDKNGGNDTNQH